MTTPSLDDPLFLAYTGTDAHPAIEGFDPGVGADLYTTNGTTDDYSYSKTGALSWTPELSEGCENCGFVFPDDEALVEAEFQKQPALRPRPGEVGAGSGLSRSRTSARRSRPSISRHVGIDPEKSGNPLSDFRFSVSYGDPQPVQVLAKRSLGAVTLKYQVNGGPVQTASTSEWAGGERYGSGGDFYYHLVRGNVTGTSPGDSVKVWFEDADNPAAKSESFTYTARGRVERPRARARGRGLHRHLARLQASRARSTSRTTSTRWPRTVSRPTSTTSTRTAARHRALSASSSHYDAVIWYTGDDVITREPGMVPGNRVPARPRRAARRAPVHRRGRAAALHGQERRLPVRVRLRVRPRARTSRAIPTRPRTAASRSRTTSCSTTSARTRRTTRRGPTANGKLFDVLGSDTPFVGLSWSFGGPSANNQNESASFISTSGILPVDRYPQFTSWASAKYDRPGGAFAPHTGEYYAYSQIADVSYKRLDADDRPDRGRDRKPVVLDLARHRAGLGLRVRRGAHGRAGRLDDVARCERAHEPELGPPDPDLSSCSAGWHEHPPVARPLPDAQRGLDAAARPAPRASGTPRPAPRAAWEQWSIDLSRYAGRQVEVSISYVSDWSVQGLGVFVDDTAVSTGATTSFEDRPRRLGDRRPGARERRERERLDADDRRRLPRGCRRSRRPTRSTSGSASRASPRRRRGTPSWAASCSTCSAENARRHARGPRAARPPRLLGLA